MSTPTLLPKLTRKKLPEHFRGLGFTRGAEIGTWRGEFAAALCAGIPGLHLICVDPWLSVDSYKDSKNDPPSQERFDKAYVAAQLNLAAHDVELLRMTSVEAAPLVADGSLDFVYIDGNHNKPYVLADLEAWTPKVRKGGVISGHDYVRNKRKPFIQVIEAVQEHVRKHRIAEWFVCGDDTPSFMWVKA